MKTFYKYAAFAAAALAGLCACSSDDDAAETGSGLQPVAQPQIIVSDLTTTGFTLRWEAVDDAGSYVYTFDGGSETSTTGCRLEFNSLERQKEYVVAVKACPRDPAEYTESPFTYIHVLTDDLEQLPQPKITLGSAYASKTVISWTEVPEAELYEFSVDGGEVSTTRNRTVILSKLDKGRTYSFSVRAMTSDATRFTNSEAAQLSFVTSDADVPPLVIAPTTIISDAVAFDIYASSDETYYYEILPATTFAKYSPEELMTAFQTYIVEYAKKQGISLQLAMASMLKSGTQSLQMTGLTPELSYVIFAFGMDLRGNITSNLSSTQFKTTADGYSAGPNYGGSDWFTQRFYITNAYLALTGYGWTNSVWTHWKGDDVTDVRYRTLTTKLFNQVFSDPYDRQAIAAFLKDPNYGVQFNPELLSATVNSADGYNGLTEGVSAGTSYTLLTLATSIEGHPDNVAPAMLGGFVTSVYDEGQVYSVKKNIDEQLAFAAFVPDFRLLTSKARAALPDMVSHKDAVYNLSRAALATAAFCDGDYSLLGVATKDSLHQKYRLPLIDGGDEMFELAQDLGALAVYISGAGPTIMAVVPRDDQEFFARAQEALPQSEKLKHFTVYRLLPDNTGATVE